MSQRKRKEIVPGAFIGFRLQQAEGSEIIAAQLNACANVNDKLNEILREYYNVSSGSEKAPAGSAAASAALDVNQVTDEVFRKLAPLITTIVRQETKKEETADTDGIGETGIDQQAAARESLSATSSQNDEIKKSAAAVLVDENKPRNVPSRPEEEWPKPLAADDPGPIEPEKEDEDEVDPAELDTLLDF